MTLAQYKTNIRYHEWCSSVQTNGAGKKGFSNNKRSHEKSRVLHCDRPDSLCYIVLLLQRGTSKPTRTQKSEKQRALFLLKRT